MSRGKGWERGRKKGGMGNRQREGEREIGSSK